MSDTTKDAEKLLKHYDFEYVYLAILILFLFGLFHILPTFQLGSRRSWAILLTYIFIFILLFLIIFMLRKFPKAKRNCFGILLFIDTDGDECDAIIKKRFIDLIRYIIRNAKATQYDVISLKDFQRKRFDGAHKDKTLSQRLLKKTRCDFVVFGQAIMGDSSENICCTINLTSAIQHPAMEERSNTLLEYEMGHIFEPLHEITIFNETVSSDFKSKAVQLEYVIKYILATAVLMCGDVDNALYIFESIKDVKACKEKTEVTNTIAREIDNRVGLCNLIVCNKKIDKYYETGKETLLEEIYARIQNTNYRSDSLNYGKHLLLAIYYMFYEKNSQKALHEIEMCKKTCENDFRWRFSDSFIRLYKSDAKTNFLRAYKVYSTYWTKLPLSSQHAIEDSVFFTLNRFPEKKQLYFFMCLIAYFSNDTSLLAIYLPKIKIDYANHMGDKNFQNIITQMDCLLSANCED